MSISARRPYVTALFLAVIIFAAPIGIAPAEASPADSYSGTHFGAGNLPPGCIADMSKPAPENICYHMRNDLNGLDSPKVDVLVMVPASPTAERDMRIMRQSVEMWEGGIDYLAREMGLDWLADGMNFHISIDYFDPVGGQGGEFTTYPIVDPEIVVIAANPIGVGRAGIGIDPVDFVFTNENLVPCHNVENPFDFEHWKNLPGFNSHHESRSGTYVEDCEGKGGNICFAINAATDPPDIDLGLGLFDLVSHEFGHCLTIGHVGDGAEGDWGAVPTNDIMAYDDDPPGITKCVSTLDVESVAVRMSNYLDVNGDGEVTAPDRLEYNDPVGVGDPFGQGSNPFQVQHPDDHLYASGSGSPLDCPQPDVGLIPGPRTDWTPEPAADGDGDGVPDASDNCPEVTNRGQQDSDGDGLGDACDADRDGDGFSNETDNCPDVANPGQEDSNGDGTGDACPPDADGDGVADEFDNCPNDKNADQKDSDSDGLGDVCDEVAPTTRYFWHSGASRSSQVDQVSGTATFDTNVPTSQTDAISVDTPILRGTAADSRWTGAFTGLIERLKFDFWFKSDVSPFGGAYDVSLATGPPFTDRLVGRIEVPWTAGDIGHAEITLALAEPFVANGQQLRLTLHSVFADAPQIIVFDSVDHPSGFTVNPLPDADGDGVPDESDNCRNVANGAQADSDDDGIGDACDTDRDGDGVANEQDNCPTVANPGQEDEDNDGIGDACDGPPCMSVSDASASPESVNYFHRSGSPGSEINEADSLQDGASFDEIPPTSNVPAQSLDVPLLGGETNDVPERVVDATWTGHIDGQIRCLTFDLFQKNHIGEAFFGTADYQVRVVVGSGPDATVYRLEDLSAEGSAEPITHIRQSITQMVGARGDLIDLSIDPEGKQVTIMLRDIWLFGPSTILYDSVNHPSGIVVNEGLKELEVSDQDGDGVPDESDNCADVANADQADSDGDGIGDACDAAQTTVAFTDDSADGGHFSDEATIAASLVDEDTDRPIAGADLVFTLTGPGGFSEQWTVETNQDGVASEARRLEGIPATYDLTVEFLGEQDVYEGDSDQQFFYVEKEITVTTLDVQGKGKKRILTATLVEDDGPDLNADRVIVFYANDVEIGRAETNESGVATLQAPQGYRGDHFDFEARFAGDDYYRASSGSDST